MSNTRRFAANDHKAFGVCPLTVSQTCAPVYTETAGCAKTMISVNPL